MSQAATRLLADPKRIWVSSIFLKLELLPQALYFQQDDERDFYDAFLSQVVGWAAGLDAIAACALAEASTYGLGALDALHVASALTLGAEELVTIEKATKPLHRVKSIRVVGLQPAGP